MGLCGPLETQLLCVRNDRGAPSQLSVEARRWGREGAEVGSLAGSRQRGDISRWLGSGRPLASLPSGLPSRRGFISSRLALLSLCAHSLLMGVFGFLVTMQRRFENVRRQKPLFVLLGG